MAMTQHTGDRTLRAPGGVLSIYGMMRAPCTSVADKLSPVKGIFWGSGSVVLEQAPREGPAHLHAQEGVQPLLCSSHFPRYNSLGFPPFSVISSFTEL